MLPKPKLKRGRQPIQPEHTRPCFVGGCMKGNERCEECLHFDLENTRCNKFPDFEYLIKPINFTCDWHNVE